MNEFMPTEKEAVSTALKVKSIENEVSRLQKTASIGVRLIKEGLKDKDDELEEHLLPQLERIIETLNLPDKDIAEDLLVLGYDIDTELEHGSGIGETLLGSIKELTTIILHLLQDEFPSATKVEAELVIGRMIDSHKGGYFVDTLLNVIEERKDIMRSIKGTSYIVDDSTGLVEQRKS